MQLLLWMPSVNLFYRQNFDCIIVAATLTALCGHPYAEESHNEWQWLMGS